MSAIQNSTAPVDLRNPEVAKAGLRAFFRIAAAWGLDAREQMALLGISSRTTLSAWRRSEVNALNRDTLERLSYIFGIYAALQILLPTAEASDEWIRKPNDAPLFGGRSALERLRAGNVADLFLVRQYLDAQRGGWS